MPKLPKNFRATKQALLASLIIPAIFLVALPKLSTSYALFRFLPSFTTSNPPPIPIPSSSPTVENTPTPTATATSKSTPTTKPTDTPTPRPNTTTTPMATSSKDYVMTQINQYRGSQGLPTVKTDTNTCNFAKIRAGEISAAFNHDGFSNRINSKTLPYPSYHYVTENIAMNSNYKNVVNTWINSPGHAANMRADTLYVCVEQSGNYFVYEGWKL